MPTHLSEKLISWASILEPKTLAQAQATSTLPYIYPHLALMPDAHLGKGATVGSVIPTLRAIIPAAVGVDIGCGMIAVRTQFSTDDVRGRDLRALRVSIEKAVPLSAGGANQRLTETAAARVAELEADAEVDYDRHAARWRLQLGLARVRQPLHRGDGRRGAAGVAVPALGFTRCRQPDRAAPHRHRQGRVPRGEGRAAGPGPRASRGGDRGVRRVHA
jgi:hypothetical protein